MKREWTWLLTAVLACVLALPAFAAPEQEKPKKQRAAVKKFIDDQPGKGSLPSKEEQELLRLQHPATRGEILASAEKHLKRLETEKVTASDCLAMSGLYKAYREKPFITADTGLDSQYFTQLLNLFDALKKNSAAMTNSPKAEQAKLKQQRKALLKKLSALIEHPIDAPSAQVKEQQKAKKARIKELQKLIAQQKEDAKRKARRPAGQ